MKFSFLERFHVISDTVYLVLICKHIRECKPDRSAHSTRVAFAFGCRKGMHRLHHRTTKQAYILYMYIIHILKYYPPAFLGVSDLEMRYPAASKSIPYPINQPKVTPALGFTLRVRRRQILRVPKICHGIFYVSCQSK